MIFYDKMPDMECLSGDTLPEFHVAVKGGSLSGCRMQLILSRSVSPNNAVLIKECTAESGGFRVQINSDDTGDLPEHDYVMHFRLIDASGLSFRKLAGRLYIHSVPKGGA